MNDNGMRSNRLCHRQQQRRRRQEEGQEQHQEEEEEEGGGGGGSRLRRSASDVDPRSQHRGEEGGGSGRGRLGEEDGRSQIGGASGGGGGKGTQHGKKRRLLVGQMDGKERALLNVKGVEEVDVEGPGGIQQLRKHVRNLLDLCKVESFLDVVASAGAVEAVVRLLKKLNGGGKETKK